ncbi:GCN5-related N-acetyltransferase [Desulfofarcimen acetoxidans DSM 771]|uniref:GCN5-related N-acetyltransferase n=1 Tax=Desulfofarcimen acetoxidans (strain ATCC 49208 / DSM 771 / KCTC 5769 / VKM B-1644 / 5575) TaxID=485916 RepID=C8VZ68_DESAS|nr:GNAT family N-acetyltransferase [Desulfofarcimen acetoxidans]ACV62978.1 GCN5-related N-acetyltransferase [Desulfofarcimen acetoxidans DSM 771]
MQIRIAVMEDINSVISLLKQFMIFENADLLTDIQYKSMFEIVIENPQKAIFVVAQKNNQLVGMLTMVFGFSTWKGKDYVIIDDVFVLPSYRLMGVATNLINNAFRIAEERNCVRVDLVTEIDNYMAQKLYDKLGFKQLRRILFTKVFQVGT